MNEYLFLPIRPEAYEEACTLLINCFVEDCYFRQQHHDSDRRSMLEQMFRHSLSVCLENGLVFGWWEPGSEKLIAISLWFDYNKLRRDRPDDFGRIFCWPSFSPSQNELAEHINRNIGEDSEYLYLLSIAVDPAYRRQGLALRMIRRVRDCYCQYHIFSDVSNDALADALQQQCGFEQVDRSTGCRLMRFLTPMYGELQEILSEEKIAVVVPGDYEPSELFHGIARKRIPLQFLSVVEGTPYFIQDITSTGASGDLLELTAAQLYRWQQLVNPLLCEEIRVVCEEGNAVVYTHQRGTPVTFLHYGNRLLEDIGRYRNEWRHVLDMYTLIPMSYDDAALLDGHTPESVNVRRLLRAVNFRAKYESGIYVEGKPGHSFASRVNRRFLELCTMQLYCESELSLDGLRASDREIGEPVVAALTVSYDRLTACAVVQITLLSSGLLPTQYLDSVSRNQLSVQTPSGKENLYGYLESHYGLHKRGSPKNYINFHEKRAAIDNGLLASILYCETYYECGESLGGVLDAGIVDQLKSTHGLAQYDYASAYFHTNAVVHIIENDPCVRDRIISESVTLFYIEMVLYEESAIEIMNYNVVHFLTAVNEYSHRMLIIHINMLLNKHLMSIAFWNMKMNYPSSTSSLELIRKAFVMEEKRTEVERNKQQLLSLAQIRQNYLSYVESRIITILGLLLTLLSIADFVINSSKTRLLLYTAGAFVLVWLFIRGRLSNLHK